MHLAREPAANVPRRSLRCKANGRSNLAYQIGKTPAKTAY
jgi:hypothetical protein